MVWILLTIAIVILFILYLYLERRSKKQLNKLLEEYNEDINKSRPSSGNAPDRYGNTSGCRETVDRSNESKPVIKRNVKSKTGRVLPATDSITPSEDKRESGTNIEQEVNEQI